MSGDLRRTVDLATPAAFTERAIDAAIGPMGRDRIIWAVRPRLGLRAQREWQRQTSSAARPRRRVPLRMTVDAIRHGFHRRLRAGGAAERIGAEVRYDLHGGVLHAWTTENQAVAFGRRDQGPRLSVSWRLGLMADDDRATLLRGLASGGGLRGDLFDPLLSRAAEEDAAAVRLLDATRPRTVVIASLEHSFQRLLVWHARARGVPSVLVPHAPTALNRAYSDLPVDMVLCQGWKDIAHYGGLGAATAGMVAVGAAGMPTIRPDRARDPGLRGTAVLAATARIRFVDLEDVLLAAQELVGAVGLELIVSPHPRERGPVRTLTERLGIPCHDGRTRDLIERRPAVVLGELSSGALLEATTSDVPAAFLTGYPEYAFMSDLGIERCEDAGALVELTAEPRTEAGALRESSLGWVASTGPDAQQRMDAVLAQRLEQSNPVLDSWGAFS